MSGEYGGCGIVEIFLSVKISELQKTIGTVHCHDAKTNHFPILFAFFAESNLLNAF